MRPISEASLIKSVTYSVKCPAVATRAIRYFCAASSNTSVTPSFSTIIISVILSLASSSLLSKLTGYTWPLMYNMALAFATIPKDSLVTLPSGHNSFMTSLILLVKPFLTAFQSYISRPLLSTILFLGLNPAAIILGLSLYQPPDCVSLSLIASEGFLLICAYLFFRKYTRKVYRFHQGLYPKLYV